MTTMKTIPLVDLNRQYQLLEPEINAAMSRVIHRSNFILGKEVEEFEEQVELVQRKIDAVQVAKSSQRVPARYLDEISHSLPEQVWLVALQESGLRMRISGKSLNGDPGVADFMTNIGQSPLFGTASLVESKSEIIDDHQVKSFTITVPLVAVEKGQAI